MYGRGAILRVDLTSEKISKETMSPELCQKYLGGEGINARLLWEHFLKIDPKVDPLSPENVLIIGIGPLGATGLGLGTKTKWTFKSPLTRIYGDTSSSGWLGSNLRWSGYDHVVITGKAKHPVYLWVNDDTVEIRDARHLWGKNTEETDDILRDELGSIKIGTAGIGQAGENLVRFASIIADKHRAAGRCGGGCVFGSKNLKAIAALGTKGIDVSDPATFLKATKDTFTGLFNDMEMRNRWKKYGTTGGLRYYHDWGAVSYRNCSTTLVSDEVFDKISGQWYLDNMENRSFMPCSTGCACACGNWCTIKGNESEAAARYSGERGVRPEYGNWASFAGGPSVEDLPAVIHLTNKCNEYGMDTFEVGMGAALLMELRERDIITEQDITEWMGEPLPLNWGNWETIDKLTDAIGLQKNKMGQILNDCIYQTALKIEQLKGVPVLKYANYGKGGVTHEQTARGNPEMAMGMATAPIGAHHTKALSINPETADYFLGNTEGGNAKTTTLKGAAHVIAEVISAIGNSLGICWFMVGGGRWTPHDLPLELFATALSAATGTETTAQEIFAAGERLTNTCKAFNSRLGLRREDDILCERIMKEPQVEGEAKGWKAEDYIEQLKDEYYAYHGWDVATALPTKEKLEELNMGDVAKVLAKEDAIV